MYSHLIKRLQQRLQPWLKPLLRRFARPSYQWREHKVESIGVLDAFYSGACVLERTQLNYTRIDLPSVPPARRRDALALELEQQAPFQAPATGWVLWQGSRACVWYWPTSVTEEIRQAQPHLGSATFVPETALWPALAPGECRWIENPARSLYLLQYQSERQGLYEQRFARELPQAQAHGWFMRHGALGELPEAPVTEPDRYAAAVQGQSLEPTQSALEHRLLPLTAVLLGALILMYLVALGRLTWSEAQIRAEQQTLEAQVEPLMEQRARVDELSQSVQRLSGIEQPAQTLLAGALAEILEVRGGRLIRWQYRERQLTVLWRPEEGRGERDSTKMIEKLEAVSGLDSVRAEIKNDGAIEVSLDVDPAQFDPGRLEFTAEPEAQTEVDDV